MVAETNKFDGHYLSGRSLDGFVNYTEASAYVLLGVVSGKREQRETYCQAPPASGTHRREHLRPLRLAHIQYGTE